MLWVIFAFLTGAAIFSVLWPLSRAPAHLDARELDVDFYKAQTAEIERDVTRGVIGTEEAAVARTEAARRLVSASHQDTPESRTGLALDRRIAALACLAFVPALALGIYWKIGAPGMPDDPLQARLNAPPNQMDMATAIARIELHLTQHPEDGRGWSVLAPIYLRLQRFDDAQRALSNVIRILGPSGDRYAALGEAQVNAGGGTVSADAKHAFEEAVKLEPKSPRANFYLGVAAEQAGDKPKAVEIWRTLLTNSPPDAPWVPTVQNHIAEATGQPAPQASAGGMPRGPKADAVAAMPQDQQQAMIHRMVDGLAQRLKSNGNDIDGWLRLVRAYRVLNEGDKAKVALTDAKRTFASNPDATKRLDELATNWAWKVEMTRKKRRLTLIGAALCTIGLAAGISLYALRDSIVFFYGPTEYAAKAPAPGTRLRIGGLVEAGSFKREGEGKVIFAVTDTKHDIHVTYTGMLPDLFREGQGAVVEGQVGRDGVFVADSVLAKHDERYMPKEVADALKKQGVWKEGDQAPSTGPASTKPADGPADKRASASP